LTDTFDITHPVRRNDHERTHRAMTDETDLDAEVRSDVDQAPPMPAWATRWLRHC
jgi:hypothetical protein